jgi:hypothetical protein
VSLRLSSLPDALRAQGIEPVLVAGWEARGLAFDAKPTITLRHWTAGPKVGKAPSLGTVTNGRSDLPGPLCQVLQERTGGAGLDRAYVVASGRANHAGTGTWAGVNSGNRMGTGLEIEWSGDPTEDFNARRIESSVRIVTALQTLSSAPAGKWCCEHREYATPAGRKVDTNLPGDVLRTSVQARLDGGDDMAFTAAQEKDIADAAALFLRGAPAYGIAHWAQIALSIDGHDVGTPGQAGFRQSLRNFIKDQERGQQKAIIDAVNAIPAKVVELLPPSAGGGLTEAQVQEACRKAVVAELGFLKPGV